MDKYRESTKQAGYARELKRLADNHEVIKDAMGGLILAPVDLSKPGLRILDCATADGISPRTRVDPFSCSVCAFSTSGLLLMAFSAPAYRHVAP
jgi:hypothetical protein